MLVHSAAWVGKDSTFSKLSEMFSCGSRGEIGRCNTRTTCEDASDTVSTTIGDWEKQLWSALQFFFCGAERLQSDGARGAHQPPVLVSFGDYVSGASTARPLQKPWQEQVQKPSGAHLKLALLFGSTYVCEQTLLSVTIIHDGYDIARYDENWNKCNDSRHQEPVHSQNVQHLSLDAAPGSSQ